MQVAPRSLVIFSAMLLSSAALAQDELQSRGAYLVESIAACGTCHTPRSADDLPIAGMALAGRVMVESPDQSVYAANITPDEETGIGTWSDDEIIRVIREGVRPDGSLLGSAMPITLYRQVSDGDIRAIVAYLRTLPAVSNAMPKSEYKGPLPKSYGPAVGVVAEPDRDDPVSYGAYLAGPLGHCIKCHTPTAEEREGDYHRVGAGGNLYMPGGIPTVSANITSNRELGLGLWTDTEIKTAITDGIGRDGKTRLPMMGERPYNKLSNEDLDALVAYLRSLEPWPR